MKVLLINPPFSFHETIYASIPLLLGQLEGNGIDAEGIDLNYEFINDITKPEYLQSTTELLEKIYNSNDEHSGSKHQGKYDLNEQQIKQQKNLIKKYLDKKESLDYMIKNANKAYHSYLKCNDDNKSNALLKIVFIALIYNFLVYYPSQLIILAQSIYELNPLYSDNYEDIIYLSTNKEKNIYIPYFEKKIKEINADKYDVIGITVPFENNFYQALTLARLLKKHTKAKVVLGGIHISLLIDNLKKYPNLFEEYVDALMCGEGEKAIVDYVHSVEGKFPIEDVSGLVYKKNNEIKQNPVKYINNINDIKPLSFKGIKKEHYKKPYITLEFSKGCYWGRCCFCYTSQLKRYHTINPVKAVDIIEDYVKKFGITSYSIVDDALSINFAEKFADELLKRKLNIKYNCFFRIEKGLTFKLLTKLKQSGLTGIFLGIESGSERILKLMNKGINLKEAKRILKDTHEIDINTVVAFICCFPTETQEDLLKTINFINENRSNIGSTVMSNFSLVKSSPILKLKDKLQISNIKDDENFSIFLSYDSPGINIEQAQNILKKHNLSIDSIFTKSIIKDVYELHSDYYAKL